MADSPDFGKKWVEYQWFKNVAVSVGCTEYNIRDSGWVRKSLAVEKQEHQMQEDEDEGGGKISYLSKQRLRVELMRGEDSWRSHSRRFVKPHRGCCSDCCSEGE